LDGAATVLACSGAKAFGDGVDDVEDSVGAIGFAFVEVVAVYPCRRYLPLRVRAYVDHLVEGISP
jgi:hypothetical protein